MFQNVFQHIKKYFNKRNILFILLVSVFALSFYDIGFAEPWTPEQRGYTNQPATSSAAWAATEAASTAMRWVASILAILTSLVTLFMHPGWYTGEIFDINVYLKEIWILVSNVVYFVFAILLVWVALMNIIWKWGDYELKKQLPKFIVGILIVPFSWFIVQFLVSLASVLTAAVLSLPYDTFKNYESMAKLNTEVKVPKECKINLWGAINNASSAGSSSWWWQQAGWVKAIDCGDKWSWQTIQQMMEWSGDSKDLTQSSVFGVIQIYTFWILQFEWMDTIMQGDIMSLAWIKNLTNLSLKAIMNLLFVLVYLILLFALFLALFVRWIQIWIYMMISPLFWLFYYFWGSIWKLWKLSEFNLKNFISLAMMPVYVAAALSFWLLFIAVVWHGLTKWWWSGTILKCTGSEPNQTCAITMWWFKLSIAWAMGDKNKEWQTLTNPVGYLIMQMFSIVVLWVAIMAALKTSALTKSVVEPFESFGNHVWWVIQKLPQYTPIPFTGWLTPAWLKQIPTNIESHFSEAASKWGRDFMQRSWLWWFLSQNAEANARLTANESKARDFATWSKSFQSEVIGDVQQIMRRQETAEELFRNDKKAVEYLAMASGIAINNAEDIVKALDKINKQTNGALNWWSTINLTKDKVDELLWPNATPSSQPNSQQQTNNVTFNAFTEGWKLKKDTDWKTEAAADGVSTKVIATKFWNWLKETDFRNLLSSVDITDKPSQDSIIASIKSKDQNYIK
jgi:hypothetical protein